MTSPTQPTLLICPQKISSQSTVYCHTPDHPCCSFSTAHLLKHLHLPLTSAICSTTNCCPPTAAHTQLLIQLMNHAKTSICHLDLVKPSQQSALQPAFNSASTSIHQIHVPLAWSLHMVSNSTMGHLPQFKRTSSFSQNHQSMPSSTLIATSDVTEDCYRIVVKRFKPVNLPSKTVKYVS